MTSVQPPDDGHEPSTAEAAPFPPAPPVPDSMRTEMWAIGRVVRYWRNPRRKQNIEKMAAILRRYKWRQPIVVDRDGRIVVGDTRYLGAQHNGDKFVPVWVATDLSEAEVTAYRLADNRIAEETEWDEESLTAELELLQSMGMQLAELEEATGFDEAELAGYLEAADETAHLESMKIAQFPPYTWVLVGIPTQRFHEIAEDVERISSVGDLFCEVTANEEKP